MRPRLIRALILLAILSLVVWAFVREVDHVPDWDGPLTVGIYPYNADDSERAGRYIAALQGGHFDAIADYMQAQARRYDTAPEQPFEIRLGAPIAEAPAPPDYEAGFFRYIRWAVGLRWWHWRFDDQGLDPDIIVIARYHDPGGVPRRFHSLGIDHMRLALADLVADRSHERFNEVVLAHEMLHTVGASDLYNPASGWPRHPQGYVEPRKRPLHPQDRGELMAAGIPVTAFYARQPESLDETVIGPWTANEIGWLR